MAEISKPVKEPLLTNELDHNTTIGVLTLERLSTISDNATGRLEMIEGFTLYLCSATFETEFISVVEF